MGQLALEVQCPGAPLELELELPLTGLGQQQPLMHIALVPQGLPSGKPLLEALEALEGPLLAPFTAMGLHLPAPVHMPSVHPPPPTQQTVPLGAGV
jgi:hypothetical protein